MPAATKAVPAVGPQSLRSILNRAVESAQSAVVCSCADCGRLRRTPLRCGACGYVGAPLVWGCRCPDEAAEDVARLRQEIAALRTLGTHVPAPPSMRVPGMGITVGHAIASKERSLAHFEAIARMARHAVGEVACSHGRRECPVCATAEGRKFDPYDQAAVEHVLAIVRDLRVSLAARGLL